MVAALYISRLRFYLVAFFAGFLLRPVDAAILHLAATVSRLFAASAFCANMPFRSAITIFSPRLHSAVSSPMTHFTVFGCFQTWFSYTNPANSSVLVPHLPLMAVRVPAAATYALAGIFCRWAARAGGGVRTDCVAAAWGCLLNGTAWLRRDAHYVVAGGAAGRSPAISYPASVAGSRLPSPAPVRQQQALGAFRQILSLALAYNGLF